MGHNPKAHDGTADQNELILLAGNFHGLNIAYGMESSEFYVYERQRCLGIFAKLSAAVRLYRSMTVDVDVENLAWELSDAISSNKQYPILEIALYRDIIGEGD